MTDSLFVGGMMVRRVFFIPPFLSFIYYEYFEYREWIYWSNSFLSSILTYPYNDSAPLLVGTYLGDPTAWANSSFFSTGYMHAGPIGVIVYGVMAGILLKLLDSLVTPNAPVWMAISVIIVPFYTLFTSSDLPPALLTHGLLFALLMLYILKNVSSNSLRS